MGKRTLFAGGPIAPKRRKHDNGVTETSSLLTEILSAKDLKSLLGFHQDNGPRLRQNIQSFKIFLSSILYGGDERESSRKQGILLDYLKSATLHEEDRTGNALKELVQTWSFAEQSNDEGLLSTMPAVIALLLKTISKSVDFQNCGTSICRMLLHKDQLRLLNRSLTTSKTKERLISPCLRLLTEIVSFNGGSLARSTYLQRDITFNRLEVFLTMRKEFVKSDEINRGKPSVRINALRYLFANFQFQDSTIKADILSQPRLIRAALKDIREDDDNIIREIIESIKKSIVQDVSLHRTAKSRLLTDWALNQIASLYERQEEQGLKDGQSSIRDTAHAFLVSVCTTTDHGVLVTQNDWYPLGTEAARLNLVQDDTTLVDSNDQLWNSRYSEMVPVRNITLASFAQGLRPYANMYHRELVLSIFKAAPELVADYFLKKKAFSFEPKLSATWIGYCAFLFSVVQLPTPNFLTSALRSSTNPPPTSIVIESLMPQPLNRKALTKCFNQISELITFFAARLLIIVFQKLEIVLRNFQEDSLPRVWKHASSKLMAEFCLRCPELKHVIVAFRRCPRDHVMGREALTRLLALYYKVTPHIVLEERFDISIVLADALGNQDFRGKGHEGKHSHRLILENLLQIAQRSPSMRWWQRPDKTPLSPFTTVLRLHISPDMIGDKKIRDLLRSVTYENIILQEVTPQPSLSALIASLHTHGDWEASDSLYGFLDNCILRLVRNPIKYCGDTDELAESYSTDARESHKRTISLLIIVILEQWAFFVKASSDLAITNVAEWLVRYLEISHHIGEDSPILLAVRDGLQSQIKNKPSELLFNKALIRSSRKASPARLLEVVAIDEKGKTDEEAKPLAFYQSEISPLLRQLSHFLGPPAESEDHPGLNRWSRIELTDAIEDGAVSELLLCLCSKHPEIRKQAASNLRILMSKLEASGHPSYPQIYLLLGEVIETALPNISSEPLSFFAGTIASRCLGVLNQPLHPLYAKVNKFLNKGPIWNVPKLPSYWIDKVFLHPPTEDNSWGQEVLWLLESLIAGLVTPLEMELYRRAKVFERVLSLSASPTLPPDCSDKVIHLLYRCTFVDGSTALVTRCGVTSWMETRMELGKFPETNLLTILAKRIWEMCEHERVDKWSSSGVTRNVRRVPSTTGRTIVAVRGVKMAFDAAVIACIAVATIAVAAITITAITIAQVRINAVLIAGLGVARLAIDALAITTQNLELPACTRTY